MAAASPMKLLNIRNSALQNLIRRHLLLHPSAAAASNLLPSTSSESINSFLLKSPWPSSNPYLPQWPLGSSPMQIELARTYVTKDDLVHEEDPDGLDDDDKDDDLENYSGSDFDDEDEYEDPDQDPDICCSPGGIKH